MIGGICLGSLPQLPVSSNLVRRLADRFVKTARDSGLDVIHLPLMRRVVEIFRDFGRHTGHQHPHIQAAMENHTRLLEAMDLPQDEIRRRVASAADWIR